MAGVAGPATLHEAAPLCVADSATPARVGCLARAAGVSKRVRGEADAGVPFGDGHFEAKLISSTSASGSTLVLSSPQPVTPGHKLVIPRRVVPRTADLTDTEFDDLWRTVRAAAAASHGGGAEAVNVALPDGPAAGQPVPHVHAHVVPRRPGDFQVNDDVYEAIEAWQPWPAAGDAETTAKKLEVPPDGERRSRSPEEMAAEASSYREVLAAMGEVEQSPLPQQQRFAKIVLDAGQLFFASGTGLTVAFVNLKPLVPGHVLVVPRRPVALLLDLDEEELVDLFRSVRTVQRVVEGQHGATASHLGIQDGRAAGQSVPHVHVHILPRQDGR